MNMLKRSKKAATETTHNSELELRHVNDDHAVLAAAGECRRLEQALQDTRCALAGDSGGESEPASRFDSEGDAERLLTGTPVSDLTVNVSESPRSTLLRRLYALQRAVPAAQDRRRAAFYEACQREIARVRPLLADSYERVLLAFESLGLEIRRHHVLLTSIRAHGLHHESLGPWNLTPREEQLLFGGQVPSIEKYCQMRREAVGLGDGKE